MIKINICYNVIKVPPTKFSSGKGSITKIKILHYKNYCKNELSLELSYANAKQICHIF